jgi:hypothetical protein
MKATIKIEFVEQSKAVTAQAKVELEGDCKSDDDLKQLRELAQKESIEAFDWAFRKSQAYSVKK